MNLDQFTDRDITAEPLKPEEVAFLNENKFDLDPEVATRLGVDQTPAVPDPVTRDGLPAVPPAGDDLDIGDDDDLDDKARIAKEVSKATDPLKKQFEAQNQVLQQQRDVSEVDAFIRNDKLGVADKYRDTMLKYMKVYPNVPVNAVFNIVAGPELMAIGARREREAAAKANGTKVISSSGGRNGGAGAKKDWSQVSAEEFQAKKAEVMGRPM